MVGVSQKHLIFSSEIKNNRDMKATVKFYLIILELTAIICSVLLGIGAAESSMWWQAYAFILGPIIYGKVVGFGKHMDFLEAYSRARRLKRS